MRKIFIVAFFCLQLIGIVYSRFVDERYFCWAPFDQISMYEIEGNVNGVDFSREEIKKRYGLTTPGRENRSIHNVFGIIQQHERTYGKKDTVSINVTFSTNGKESKEWSFSTK
jgi:hypothetical protein